jgi:glycerophosphoryl diester phosphodiesterase
MTVHNRRFRHDGDGGRKAINTAPINIDQSDVIRRRTQKEDSAASSSSSSLTCHSIPLTVPTSSNAVNPYADHHSTSVVIAHRGASAHLPEHTLAGYRLALELGADYIEPDLVSTSDRHLVALHSLDLAATTNVEDVFPASRKTPSQYMKGELGYWVYTFTLEEIKTLRLKQRLGSEEYGRSHVFDGLFEIPTLTEILELLVEWNNSVQPLWYNPNATLLPVDSGGSGGAGDGGDISNGNIHYERKPPGPSGRLYAELKDFPWLLEDAGINLLDLLFDHMMTTTTTTTSSSLLWEEAIFKYMCNTKVVSTDYSYKLPPLILQSFEASVLQNFTQRWAEYSSNEPDDPSSSSLFTYQVSSTNEIDGETTTTTNLPLPVPPTILLVPHTKCHDFDHFWFDIQSTYRDVISGIGPDKNCFFSVSPKNGETPNNNDTPIHVLQQDIMDLAVKLDWVVHPYTERPESSFLVSPPSASSSEAAGASSSPYFANVLEELMYLRCVVGVHGVFSESVDVAVRAMNMPCPAGYDLVSLSGANSEVVAHQTSMESSSGSSSSSSSSSGSSSSTPPTSCPPTSSQNAINTVFNGEDVPLGPVVLLSFTMGLVVALCLCCCWQRLVLCRRRRRGGAASSVDGISRPASRNGAGIVAGTGNGPASKIMNARRRGGTPRHDHSAIPTNDDDYDGDLELTEADREIL